jgi:superkiller protein 3
MPHRTLSSVVLVVALAACLAAGCGDKDMKASIAEMNQGVELYEQGAFGTAENHFKKAVSLREDHHQAWYNLGLTLEVQRKWDDAATAYASAVRHKPDEPQYRYHLGHSHLMSEKKNLAEAQTNLEEAVKLNDRLYKAWFDLGIVYDAQDQPKKAAEAWTKSASLFPGFGKPFNRLGMLYIKWDMLDLAIKVLENGLVKVNSRYIVIDDAERSDIFYHLGLAYEMKNQLDKAIEMYTEALALRADNLDARRQRGFSYGEKGDKANAKEDLEAFVKSGGAGDAFQIQAANERLLRLSYQ